MIELCINEFGETLGQLIFENWCQFLDDFETPLGKTKIESNRFLEICNSINPYIKFTMETSDKELPSLDVLIKRNDDEIWMDIYFKPIDIRRCPQFLSSHPNHCKKNIPFTEHGELVL